MSYKASTYRASTDRKIARVIPWMWQRYSFLSIGYMQTGPNPWQISRAFTRGVKRYKDSVRESERVWEREREERESFFTRTNVSTTGKATRMWCQARWIDVKHVNSEVYIRIGKISVDEEVSRKLMAGEYASKFSEENTRFFTIFFPFFSFLFCA